MLDGDHDNGILLSLLEFDFDVATGVGQVCDSVSEEIFESVGRNHNDSDIDPARLERISNVDDIFGQEIASSGDLDFDADVGDNGTIELEPPNPVDVAGGALFPTVVGGRYRFVVSFEGTVDGLSKHAGPVCLFLGKNKDLRGEQDVGDLKKESRKPEPTHFFSRAAVVEDLSDLHCR